MAKFCNNRKAARMLLDLWLKSVVAVLLISSVQKTAAIRSDRLRTYQSVLNNLAQPNNLIAGDNAHAVYDQGNDRLHSGVTSEDGDSPISNIDGCSCNYHADVQYTQESYYLPDGMPAFRVTFTNTCLDCTYYNIHILCGDYSSPKMPDPKIFRKLAVNNCLLNDGNPIPPQNTVAFEYESTKSYPMTVGRARCSC